MKKSTVFTVIAVTVWVILVPLRDVLSIVEGYQAGSVTSLELLEVSVGFLILVGALMLAFFLARGSQRRRTLREERERRDFLEQDRMS